MNNLEIGLKQRAASQSLGFTFLPTPLCYSIFTNMAYRGLIIILCVCFFFYRPKQSKPEAFLVCVCVCVSRRLTDAYLHVCSCRVCFLVGIES